MARPNGCSCSGSRARLPSLIYIALVGLLTSIYLAPPASLPNRLEPLDSEPTGADYSTSSIVNTWWNLDYWSPKMPLGQLLGRAEDCFLDGLSGAQKQSNNLKYLVLHSSPSKLCQNSAFASSKCIQIPLHTHSNKTGVPYFLPYPPAYFDAVIYQGILDNTLDISRVIFEAKRVLKDDGTLRFDATNRNIGTWIHHTINQRLMGLFPSRFQNWRLFITPEEITRVLSAYKFKNLKTRSYTSSFDLIALLSGEGVLPSISVANTDTPSHQYCMIATNSGAKN